MASYDNGLRDSEEERELEVFTDFPTILPYQYEPLASEDDTEEEDVSLPTVVTPRLGHSMW